MKKVILFLCTLLSTFFSYSQKGNSIIDMEEFFLYLNQKTNDTVKYNILKLPEDFMSSKLYNSDLNNNITNDLSKSVSKLRKYLFDKGVKGVGWEKDVIFTSYYRYLNKIPIDLNGQIERIIRIINGNIIKEKFPNGKPKSIENVELIKNKTTIDELLKKFSLGQRIVFNSGGNKGVFNKDVSIRTFGKIIGYSEKKELIAQELIVEITEIKLSDCIKSEYKKGDIITVNPFFCLLLPL